MLEVDGISKSYSGIRVLSPVSFCLPAGHCIGITGENGSGKSTLLRLLAQVEAPDSGDIRYGGKSILANRPFLRRNLGYVPQGTDLMEDLTVRKHLQLWQSAYGLQGPIPEEITELLDLQPMMNKKIRTLSGGMKRRVSIATALIHAPSILIMDEATAGLDREYTGRLLSWLETYLANNGSIIWCSHHKEELNRLCGACIRIHQGRQLAP